MGRIGGLAALLACALVSGCEAEVERTTASFALTQLGSCSLRGLSRLELTVAGDFPSRHRGPLGADERLSLDALPIEARAVSIDARAAGGDAVALALLPETDARAPLPLMPVDRSCPIGDTLVFAPPGAAVAATPGGALLIAGGRDEVGLSLRTVIVLPPRSELGSQVEGGLSSPRAFASATKVALGVMVAGGGAGEEGPAYDTFEIYDEGAQRFLPPQVLVGGGRRSHGAASLPDGRVLLVGGVRERGGEPLESAAVIDPETGEGRELVGVLQQARVDPTVLVLDDGSVLVLLGRESDAAAAPSVSGVERLDLERGSSERVATLPVHTLTAAAALDGGRVAFVGCTDSGDDRPDCELLLLVPGDEGRLDVVRDVIALDALRREAVEAADPPLTSLQLAPLRDGKLLSIARVGQARAVLLDLARGLVISDRVDATRVPDHLVTLADGTLAEVDAFGTSLRRHDARSAFHDAPQRLLSPDALSPDRPGRARFEADADGVPVAVAAEGGPVRLELPFLRFGRLRLELALDGEGRVLLRPERARAVAIEVSADRVALGDCGVERAAQSAPIVIERHDAELTLSAGGTRMACARASLSPLLGLAFGLEDGARLHALRVERR